MSQKNAENYRKTDTILRNVSQKIFFQMVLIQNRTNVARTKRHQSNKATRTRNFEVIIRIPQQWIHRFLVSVGGSLRTYIISLLGCLIRTLNRNPERRLYVRFTFADNQLTQANGDLQAFSPVSASLYKPVDSFPPDRRNVARSIRTLPFRTVTNERLLSV